MSFKLIYYSEYFCDITQDACRRGTLPQCPPEKGGVIVPCKHFVKAEKESSR
jgi:hypothetical protein